MVFSQLSFFFSFFSSSGLSYFNGDYHFGVLFCPIFYLHQVCQT